MRGLKIRAAVATGIVASGLLVAAVAQEVVSSIHDVAAEIISRLSDSGISGSLRDGLYFATFGQEDLVAAHALSLNPEVTEAEQLVEMGFSQRVTAAQAAYANAAEILRKFAQEAGGHTFLPGASDRLQALGYPTAPAEVATAFAEDAEAISTLLTLGVLSRDGTGVIELTTSGGGSIKVKVEDALGAAMELANSLGTAILAVGPISGGGLVDMR